MSARLRISASWIPGRAAGFRASASAAAAVALPCPSAQIPDANAIENPAAIGTQFVAALSPPCANAGTAKHSRDRIRNILLQLIISYFSSHEIAASGWLTFTVLTPSRLRQELSPDECSVASVLFGDCFR